MRWKKCWLAVSVLCALGMLGYYKYADFFLENWNWMTGGNVRLLQLVLPAGISFYTFQITGYMIDVYRKKFPAEQSLLKLGTYLTMFSQLASGPIVNYGEVREALGKRELSAEGLEEGLRMLILGLGAKVLVADRIGLLWNDIQTIGFASISTPLAWMGAFGYSLVLYYDFAGYSMMAIGIGKMLGFAIPENFHFPYMSKSVTEFWRRWHITLGTWFRDYVYIPLGGNRVSRLRWVCNICLVWCLTGLWHGAGWNFLLWGLFYALLLLGEKLWYGAFLQRNPGIGHFYLLLSVVLGFVLFNAETLAQAFQDFKTMFGGSSLPFFSKESLYALRTNGVLLLFSILGATPLPARLYGRGKKVFQWMEPVLLALLLFICTAYLVDGSFNPFLYFRF